MRLKYQLRGLGIGLFMAALLMGITGNDKVDASTNAGEEINTQQESEETKEDFTQESIIKTEEEPTQEPVIIRQEQTSEDMTEETIVQTSEDVSENEETISQEISSEETVSENLSGEEETDVSTLENSAEKTAKSEGTSPIILQISSGDDSGTVSRKLKDAGLIDSASDFDAYLMQHGYDKKISVGTVKIEPGATWIEIAEKLAGK